MNFKNGLFITIEPSKYWVNTSTLDIKNLCENVALHFQEHLRNENKVKGNLIVSYDRNGPFIPYRNSYSDNFRIELSANNKDWSKFSYQFGHEFCHIMQNHDKILVSNSPNFWFFESICELANIWVIRRMGETWAYRPPYENWADWRHHLTDYANKKLKDCKTQHSGTGAEWLEKWEELIRKEFDLNREQRIHFTYERVSQLSYKFISIFEENPDAWNAIRQMPSSHAKMSTYIQDWYNLVDIMDKKHVKSIGNIMGISV